MQESLTGKVLGTAHGVAFIVDEDDYEKVAIHKWHTSYEGYVLRTVWNDEGKSEKIILHRILLNAPKDKIVDHINGNKLDNRKSNLRVATKKENSWNSGPRNTNTSGYKGVSYRNDIGKWRAQISVNGKRVTLGQFDCKHDAARMFNFWAKDIQGEFARLNVIKDGDEA